MHFSQEKNYKNIYFIYPHIYLYKIIVSVDKLLKTIIPILLGFGVYFYSFCFIKREIANNFYSHIVYYIINKL